MRDDALRRASLESLGALGDGVAREALERGSLEVLADGTTWEGTSGTMHGDVVVLVAPFDTVDRVRTSPAAIDALEKAIGVALGARDHRALLDLRIEVGEGRAGSPYR